MSDKLHEINFFEDAGFLFDTLEDLNILTETALWLDADNRRRGMVESPVDECMYMTMKPIPTFMVSPNEPIYINFPMRIDVHKIPEIVEEEPEEILQIDKEPQYEPQPSTSRSIEEYDSTNIYEELTSKPEPGQQPDDDNKSNSSLIILEEEEEDKEVKIEKKKTGAIPKVIKYLAKTPKKIKAKVKSMKKNFKKSSKKYEENLKFIEKDFDDLEIIDDVVVGRPSREDYPVHDARRYYVSKIKLIFFLKEN